MILLIVSLLLAHPIYTYLSFREKRESFIRFLCSILGLLINMTITLFYFYPRPFMIGVGHTLIEHAPENSFPSDHATLAFSIAFAFLFLKDFKIGIPLFILAFLVDFTRVYVGLHFPLDIVASLFVSIISGIIVIYFKKEFEKLNKIFNTLYNKLLKKLKRG